MKNKLFILCMIFPLVVFSQRSEKIFLNILDVYLKNELPRVKSRYKLDKDEILVLCGIDTIKHKDHSDYEFSYTIYELETYPELDSIKMYKGVRMLVSYPSEMKKKLSKHFKTIKENREVQESDVAIRVETVSTVQIQMNNLYEIYYFITPDDITYYKYLKKRKIKFTKDVISKSPLPIHR